MSSERLLSSRYASCTPGVLDMCVRAVAGGEDLDDVIPGFSGHKVALVARDVIEVLQAGDLKRSAPPGGDWLRTIVAESRLAEAARLWQQRKEAEAKTARERGQDILEEVAASSDRSPVLWYEDIYFEATQALLRLSDRRALARQRECIAEVLRNPEAPNLMSALRDLAVVHLKLGDYPEGLAMLAALLRHDSSDPWTFNALALDLPRLGFAAEGRLAAERGLELVHQHGDPDQLAKQLTELLLEMSRGEDRSDAPKDATADLRDALRTPFNVKGPGSSRELALRLVPDVATARVKELPPMPTADALAEMGARLRSLIPGVSSASTVPGTALPASMVSGTIRRVEPKVGRNESCPCGSGKKFKKCCG